MKNIFRVIAGVLLAVSVSGCATKQSSGTDKLSVTVSSAAVNHQVTQNDATLTALALMPRDQRQAYIKSHPDAVQAIRSSPNLQQKLKLAQVLGQP
jgi:hypothetical protein